MSYVAFSQVAIKFPQVGGIYILFPDYSKVYEFVHNFRPIYHQKDSASDVHLFLGLLSYWVVNAIRYRLKTKGETCSTCTVEKMRNHALSFFSPHPNLVTVLTHRADRGFLVAIYLLQLQRGGGAAQVVDVGIDREKVPRPSRFTL